MNGLSYHFLSLAFWLPLIALSTSAVAGQDVYKQISASKEQIRNARCSQKINPDNKRYIAVIEKAMTSDKRANVGIGGLGLKDEAVHVATAYRWLTSYMSYKLYPEGDIDYWTVFKDSSCTTAYCAAKTIFGEEKGTFYLGLLLETGFNLSTLGYGKLKAPVFQGETEPSPDNLREFNSLYNLKEWEPGQLDAYLEGIYSLPNFMYPLSYTRLAQSRVNHWRGPQLHSNATVMMYPDMQNQDDEYKTYTMVHEIGHLISSQMQFNGDLNWIDISWSYEKGGKNVRRKSEDLFVSMYSKQDFFEDFAESFAAYRFNPEALLKHSPEKFNFLKEKVFKDYDYLSEDNCPPAWGK